MDMMDNAKRVAHMPTATIVEAGIGFKVGLKLPTRVHDEAICLTGLLYSPTSPVARPARRRFWPQEKPQASQVEPYRLDRSGSHYRKACPTSGLAVAASARGVFCILQLLRSGWSQEHREMRHSSLRNTGSST